MADQQAKRKPIFPLVFGVLAVLCLSSFIASVVHHPSEWIPVARIRQVSSQYRFYDFKFDDEVQVDVAFDVEAHGWSSAETFTTHLMQGEIYLQIASGPDAEPHRTTIFWPENMICEDGVRDCENSTACQPMSSQAIIEHMQRAGMDIDATTIGNDAAKIAAFIADDSAHVRGIPSVGPARLSWSFSPRISHPGRTPMWFALAVSAGSLLPVMGVFLAVYRLTHWHMRRIEQRIVSHDRLDVTLLTLLDWRWARAAGIAEYDTTPRCRACSYNLTGNTSDICPECGTPAHPEQGPQAWDEFEK